MKKLLALIAASLALCACDTVNTVERANPSANKKMVDDIRIVTDSWLTRISGNIHLQPHKRQAAQAAPHLTGLAWGSRYSHY